MTTHPEAIADAAREWLIRARDPAFDDWDGLTAWLEADPGHLTAYDAAAEDEDWAAEVLATPMPRPLAPPAAPRRARWWLGRGVAAAGVAAVAVAGGWLALDLQPAASHEVSTAAGERRELALGDGSSMILNGSTRVRFDPAAPRAVEVASGEALFRIRHDEARPFEVRTAGGTRLIDVGTVFNVAVRRGRLDVAVAEGAVDYAATGPTIRLNAGKALSRASDGATPVVRTVASDTVGSWRAGALHFEDAPLAQVAADLADNLGRPIRVDAGARGRFTGTLSLDGRADAVLARTAPLLDVRFVPEGDGWRMVPADARGL